MATWNKKVHRWAEQWRYDFKTNWLIIMTTKTHCLLRKMISSQNVSVSNKMFKSTYK